MAQKKKRLGKGLSALMSTPVPIEPETQSVPDPILNTEQSETVSRETLPGEPPTNDDKSPAIDETSPATSPEVPTGPQLRYLNVAQLQPNRFQPRQLMNGDALIELSNSIKSDGVMQPVVVRPGEKEGQFEIVAGERRWRAAQIAKLEQIPAIIRTLDDQKLAEWAIVENLQRENLNAMEQAEAFKQLAEQFSLSHESIAERVGKSRPYISNLLRLLDLPSSIQDAVRNDLLSNGHARALLSIPDEEVALTLTEEAVRSQWSVREMEAAVKKVLSGDGNAPVGSPQSKKNARAAHLDDIAKQIGQQIGSKVKIKTGRRKGSGAITIEFYTLEQFDDLLGKLGVSLED